jgi:predicted Zn finger-like uncharacterized protein
MALMTSCPACATRFRVVPDQLRLHHGLVRCGTCDHVFDANTRLESIAEDAQQHSIIKDPANEIPSPEAWVNKPAVQALTGRSPSDLPMPSWTEITNKAIKNNLNHRQRNAVGKTRIRLNSTDAVMSSRNAGGELTIAPKATYPEGTFGDSTRYQSLDTDDALSLEAAARQSERRKRRAERKRAAEQAALDLESNADSIDQSVTKSFRTRRTNRHARGAGENQSSLYKRVSEVWQWFSAWFQSKTALRLFIGLGLITAGAQWLMLARYTVADYLPFTKPALSKLCSLSGCVVEPSVWLQPLSLDALTLGKLTTPAPSATGLQAYRVQATVRNSSQLAVKKPDIELTITNAHSAIIARKTLPAAVLAVPITATNLSASADAADTIKAGADWLIDAVVLLDEQTVGYTARVVY